MGKDWEFEERDRCHCVVHLGTREVEIQNEFCCGEETSLSDVTY